MKESIINPNLTFNNYKKTKANIFAISAAKGFCEKNYNPFVICGTNGTGKTHLLHAIANELKEKGADFLYISVADLCSDIDDAKSIDAICKNYVDVEFLLIDDFHFITSDVGIQNMLERLLRERCDKEHYTVIASAIELSDIEGVQLHLKEVLEWGMITTMGILN